MTGKTYVQWQQEHIKEEGRILRKLQPLQKLIESREIDEKKIKNVIAWLSKPRRPEDISNDFSKEKIRAKIRRRFAQADEAVLDTVIDKVDQVLDKANNGFQNELPGTIKSWKDRGCDEKDPALSWIQSQAVNIQLLAGFMVTKLLLSGSDSGQ